MKETQNPANDPASTFAACEQKSALEPCRERYRPEIDGLRAVAIIPVVLFHATHWMPGGFVGVDVFFVLSGFLITGLIVRDLRADSFSYIQFWERRFRRLMPALLVAVAATLILGCVLLLPHDLKELGQSAFAQSVGLANFYFWRESGYFAGPSEIKPLLHTWSLAVEEQFYLLMPGFLWLLYRCCRRHMLLIVCLVMLASWLWSGLSTRHYPDAAFFLLPTRAWEMLLGAFVCLCPLRLSGRSTASECIAVVGILMIAASVFLIRAGMEFPGFVATVPCVGTALVIAAALPGTLVHRMLSWTPFVYTGKLSYSWYLWHWPLIAFASYYGLADGSLLFALAVVPGSWAIAALSMRYVEQPFRTRSICAARSRLFTASLCGVAVLAFGGLALHQTGGLRARFDGATLQLAGARTDRNPARRLHHDLPLSQLATGWPGLGDFSAAGDPQIAIVGDSHGEALVPAFLALSQEHHIPIAVVTRSATAPLLGTNDDVDPGAAAYRRTVEKLIRETPDLQHVVLVARWNTYLTDPVYRAALVDTVNWLRGEEMKFTLVGQVPEPAGNVPRYLALASFWQHDIAELSATREQFRTRNSQFEAVVSETVCRASEVIPLAEWFFSSSDVAPLEIDGRPLYVDDNHLSAFGASQLVDVLRPLFVGQRRQTDRAGELSP